MQFSDERVREFQEAYKEEFGEEISSDDAREMLRRLVTLYEVLLRPLPERKEEEAGEAKESRASA
jgi:hypothetical protein